MANITLFDHTCYASRCIITELEGTPLYRCLPDGFCPQLKCKRLPRCYTSYMLSQFCPMTRLSEYLDVDVDYAVRKANLMRV